jgi:predicted PurR-regulated permease PerM
MVDFQPQGLQDTGKCLHHEGGSMMISGKIMMVNLLENWRPVGWFNLDLAVYIIYAVILASLILMLYLQVKRKRRQQPLRWRKLAAAAGIVLVFEFLVGTFFLWIFNAAGRSVTIELDSPAIMIAEDGHHLSINKMRKKIPNGQSNGISTSISHFELVAVDINTGLTSWHRKSFWQEYVMGNTSQGILTVNPKKEKLQFIDPRTGETALTEKELVAQFPELEDKGYPAKMPVP